MENCLVLKIVGISEYRGQSRNGKPYVLTTLELDYLGQKTKIKCFKDNAVIGDYAQISIGTKKTVYGAEFCVEVERIIPANEIDGNFA